MASHPAKTKKLSIKPRQILFIAAAVLVLYVIVPQVGAFRHSLELLSKAETSWAMLAGLFYLGTGLASVAIYKILLPGRLPWLPTIIIEYGSSFANRLVPAGAGAVGVNFLYFRKQKCTPSEAAAVVTVNNLLGFVGHALLIVGLLVLMPEVFRGLHIQISLLNGVIIGAGLLVFAAAVVFAIRFFKGRAARFLAQTLRDFLAYRKRPHLIAGALLFSVSITLLHSLSMWASAKALGVDLNVAQAIVVLGIGVGVGAIIPSPGGIGGAEAGLVAGLLAFHFSADQALAVAILYRLASYWLGFIVGAFGFFIAGRRRYL